MWNCTQKLKISVSQREAVNLKLLRLSYSELGTTVWNQVSVLLKIFKIVPFKLYEKISRQIARWPSPTKQCRVGSRHRLLGRIYFFRSIPHNSKNINFLDIVLLFPFKNVKFRYPLQACFALISKSLNYHYFELIWAWINNHEII